MVHYLVLERRNGPRRLRDHDDDDGYYPAYGCHKTINVCMYVLLRVPQQDLT